ncbi:MAG: PAS domain S-box protein [Deltaproteobacteria bacterium]|nr:PAS domain S-box protein [Deltaproteobacteria bacterium]
MIIKDKTEVRYIKEREDLHRRKSHIEVSEAGRKRAEEKIENLNRVLYAIRGVNQFLIREKDRERLLKGACDSLIGNRGYYSAWIAILNRSGGLFAAAEAGLGKRFLSLIKRLKAGELPDCSQRALKQSKVVLTEDPFSACTDCPLSKKYAGRGAMTVRLAHKQRIYGILSVSIPREFASDKEDQKLLKEVAGDIALALHNLELEEERNQAEKTMRKNTYKLSKRVKELNCLYSISKLGQRRRLSLEEILQRIVDLMPPAWQYPKITCARVILEGQEFRTRNFNETIWKQSGDIIVHGQPSGTLEVCYLKKRPANDEGPFLKEERSLINAIAERLERIIERKRAEKALLESEKRFRDLVENAPIGILIIQNDQIVYRNPEQEKLYGPLPRSLEFTDFEFIHPDDVEKFKKFYQDMTSGKVRTLDTDFRLYPVGKKGGRLDMKWAYCRASLIKYQGKEAILLNVMDMTRARELEHLLRIQDKMTSLGRVAAGIAHEIRNPLSGINIYLNTLEKIYDREESLDKVKEILGQLQSASSKIESVIRRVMDFSKPGTPKFVLTDINQAIEETIKLSSVTMRKRGIKIEKALTEDLPPCHADPQLIEEVILNIITNASEAMKSMDGAKKIEVSSSIENNNILVKVSDSGPGVPSSLKDKIFDPFYTTKNGSTGIGLSLAHRIITDHGGSLNISKSKWGGAEFVIEIPIKKPDS